MLVQENRVKDSKKEEKEGATIVTSSATMVEIVLTRRILQGMTTTKTTISKAMKIKGTIGSTIKERGMLLLLDMEMVNLPKG